MAYFYVVGTPIGNLEDITLRAISILKSVNLILCEDTRTTGILLKKYGIEAPLMSYHIKSKLSKIKDIIKLLEEGKNIALVSDAGTPCISDPGSLLISEIRKKIEELKTEIKIRAIPGASALTSAYSISGIKGGDFTFLGFLPHKKGRETLFKEISKSERTMIFYESPHRIMKTLESLNKFAPDKEIFIAREITKIFEEDIKGKASEISEFFKNNKEKIKGEFVVIIPPL
jgi:16S rRNA (cytidine1402-2'-O)-methyltransferase